MSKPALLALSNGDIFHGEAIGAEGMAVGEVVFNTAMTGYQEILTDPSYCQQIVTLTYPHIGNTGVNSEDEESRAIVACGLVIRALSLVPSNWRSQESLSPYLIRNNVIAIAGIDTRCLTRLLRDVGSLNACIVAGEAAGDEVAAVAAAKAFGGLQGVDLAKQVTTEQSYRWQEGIWYLDAGYVSSPQPNEQSSYHIVAYDFGIKRYILRLLTDRGCQVTVVPAQTSSEAVLALQPDGIFLSNGPGDPEPCQYAIQAIQAFITAKIPLFGICLGYQLLALAVGASTYKMKFGHHGANHPVIDLATERVMITSQNHGFAVDNETLPAQVAATHQSLFDGSLQGIKLQNAPAFGFQGHPEASPGPQDIEVLFDDFIKLIQSANTN